MKSKINELQNKITLVSKKLLLVSMLFLAFVTTAQIKVNNTESKPVLIGKLGTPTLSTVELTKTGDMVTFKYQNNNKPQVAEFKTFSFKDIESGLEGFYGVIIDGLANLPKEDTKIELPNETLSLQYKKEMNMASVKIKVSYKTGEESGTTVWLSKKNIDKLFGKL